MSAEPTDGEAAVDAHGDMAAAISDDLLHRVLFEGWRGGLLELTVDLQQGRQYRGDMPFPADFTELYYEAQAFVGLEQELDVSKGEQPDPSGLYGVGARLGGGPVQGIVFNWWGERPDLDLRLEYAGYATIGPLGFRVAAGFVGNRDGLRGHPEWTEGLGMDLDVGYGEHIELFIGVAMTDRFLPEWEPGHGTLSMGDGLRWIQDHGGVELRVVQRRPYGEDAYQAVMLSVIGRLSLHPQSGEDASPTTPLAP